MIKYITEKGYNIDNVIRADGLAVVYSISEPSDLLEEGSVVGFEDFQNAARTFGSPKSVGTIAFKKTVLSLAEDEEPFNLVNQLSGSLVAIGMISSIKSRPRHVYGYTNLKLNNYYIHTQKLHDHVIDLTMASLDKRTYGPKIFSIIRSVIFDDV